MDILTTARALFRQPVYEIPNVYEALCKLPHGYSRRVDGSIIVHELCGRVDNMVTVAEFRFNPSADMFERAVAVFISIHEGSQKLSITPGQFGINAVKLLTLFDDGDVAEVFNNLWEISSIFKMTSIRQLVDRRYLEKVDFYNGLTGLNGRVVEVDGIRFGNLLTNINNLPTFAQRLVVLDSCSGKSGRQVLMLAREARKILNPELRSVKTIANLNELVGDRNVVYCDAGAMVVDCSEVVDVIPTVRVTSTNGEPLVLSTGQCETLVGVDEKVDKSMKSFASTSFAQIRKRMNILSMLS